MPDPQMAGAQQADRRYIRASELGAHAYCAHAWWLRYGLGEEPGNREALAAGARAHARMGADIEGARRLRLLALLLLAAAVLLLLASL